MADNHPVLMQDPLTERELEIVRRIASGLTNREIAEELFLALETVRWYTKRIYSKLQVRNRTEAATLANELGLLQPGSRVQEPDPHFELPKLKLPGQVTAFIGRSHELAEFARLLDQPETRLLTILGPGGMGKSRLAMQIAKACLADFQDGIFFISLGHLSPDDSLAQAIAEGLELKLSASRHVEDQVLEYLHGKSLLLILDNFENLLPAGKFVSNLLKGTEQLKILTTSRERLDLRGETVYKLSGLELPLGEHSSEISSAASVQLFIRTAGQVRPEMPFKDEELAPIARICRLVEGMPLGILLAAAWTEILPPDEIAEEISTTLDLLATDKQDVPVRQRSIRAVFDHSLRLLSTADRLVFLQLAGFRGGFSREAAMAVAGASVRHLAAFSGKSLLQYDPASRRYRLHTLLRQYAIEELDEAGMLEPALTSHMRYFGELLRQLEQGLRGGDQVRALDQAQADFQNIRAAWAWAVHSGQVDWIAQAFEPVYWFCIIRDRVADGEKLFNEARNYLHSSAVKRIPGRLLLRFNASGEAYRTQIHKALKSVVSEREEAFLHWMLGVNGYAIRDFPRAIRSLEISLSGFESIGDDFYTVEVLHLLWMCRWFTGDAKAADPFYRQALERARRTGNTFAVARALGSAGAFMLLSGRFGEAKASTEEALQLRQDMGDHAGEAMSLAHLGWLAAIRGDLEEGILLAQSARKIAETIHNQNAHATALNVLSWSASIEGDFEYARQLCEESGKNPPDPTVKAGVDLGRAFLFCGLGDFQQSGAYLKKILEFTRAFNGEGMMLICLPVAAMLFAQQGRLARAAALAGLALSFPDDSTGWMQRWNRFIELQKELESALGHAAYLEAKESGKRLSLAEAVNFVLTET